MKPHAAQSGEEIQNIQKLISELTCNGDFAEVGVYLGGSAQIIRDAMLIERKLFLFDTFLGFEKLSEFDPIEWQNDRKKWAQELSHVYLQVVNHFAKDNNVHIFKGPFPKEHGDAVKDRKFAFVHIDADAYIPTKESLQFFYSKMNVGGVILLHDYANSTTPVKKAVDEFLVDKKETIVEIGGTQGVIKKL